MTTDPREMAKLLTDKEADIAEGPAGNQPEAYNAAVVEAFTGLLTDFKNAILEQAEE